MEELLAQDHNWAAVICAGIVYSVLTIFIWAMTRAFDDDIVLGVDVAIAGVVFFVVMEWGLGFEAPRAVTGWHTISAVLSCFAGPASVLLLAKHSRVYELEIRFLFWVAATVGGTVLAALYAMAE